MAKKKVGELIKEARTSAGLTQTQLAEQVEGVTASDISKAERNEKELSQEALKKIAKATGVTQKSLLEAAKTASGKATASAGKSSSGKTSSSKASGSGKSSSSGSSVKLTAAEKKLVELYRKADSDTKKQAVNLLSGKTTGTEAIMNSLLTGAIEAIGKTAAKK